MTLRVLFIVTLEYFYVLRPILACMWIEERNSMPPMEFEVLVNEMLSVKIELTLEINNLLQRKKAGDELDYEPKLHAIHDFIEEMITYYGNIAVTTQSQPAVNQDQLLDEMFRETLEEVWS